MSDFMASPKGIEHFTDHTKLALWNAIGVARQYHRGVIGLDHLLLGLYRTQGSVAAYILNQLGLTGKQIEKALLKLKPAELGEPLEEAQPTFEQLFERVASDVINKKSVIKTDDFLIGIVTLNDPTTQAFLAELNLTADRVRAEIARLPTHIHPLSAISEIHHPPFRVSRFAPLMRLITPIWSYLSESRRSSSSRKKTADRFTGSASQMMSVAQEIALKYHRGLVGSDHLLLAIFRDAESIAGQILRRLGLTEQQIEAAMLVIKPPTDGDPIMRLDQEAKLVLERTVAVARKMGASHLDTEHFLLAIVQTNDRPVKALLSELNVTPDRVQAEVLRTGASSVDSL
jgi:ATP-dependent Clp protease ATP-binding subunit ClpA